MAGRKHRLSNAEIHRLFFESDDSLSDWDSGDDSEFIYSCSNSVVREMMTEMIARKLYSRACDRSRRLHGQGMKLEHELAIYKFIRSSKGPISLLH